MPYDIALGICAAGTSCGYGGNVFTSYSQNDNAGVIEYSPNLNLGQTLPLLGQFLPAAPNNCAYFGAAVGTRCWSRLSGMAFDSQEISGRTALRKLATALLSLPQAALAALPFAL